MEENVQVLEESAGALYERSKTDAELTKFLLQSSTEAGEYEAALIFAQNLEKLMPDSYVPVHAKYTVLLQKGDMGEAGMCLAEAQEQFRTDPNYITDRLAYTIEVMGTAAARKYLDKIHDVPAFESERFLELCARIYNAEGEEMNCIKCLYILHKQYQSEKARFLLAVKSAEHHLYEAALKWYVTVINGYSGSAEYFMSLAGRSSMLQLLDRDNWREEMVKVANQIDLVSVTHTTNLWLRTISAGLWEVLGQEENATCNRKVIDLLQAYCENPEQYIRNAQNHEQRDNP